MSQHILTILPYILSFSSLDVMHLAGRKHPRTWLYGMLLQLLWLVWILAAQQYGFLILNLGNWIVYFRNHQLWSRS